MRATDDEPATRKKHRWDFAPPGLALAVAIVLTYLSSWIERTGPEQLPYGNLCGPSGNDLCYEPVLKGGFPVAYLFDMPGVSVQHQLSFGEDTFYPRSYVIDLAFYVVVVAAVRFVVAQRRSAASIEPAEPIEPK